jgi:hypothetical protein
MQGESPLSWITSGKQSYQHAPDERTQKRAHTMVKG